MYKRSGGDERIAIRSRIWNMQGRTALCNCGVDCQNTIRKCRQNVSVHPSTKDRALFLVTPFEEKNSYLQFQY